MSVLQFCNLIIYSPFLWLTLKCLLELQEGKAYFPRLSELSFGGSPGAYDHYQSYVNKLHERWRKGQNAIVIDDQADQVDTSFTSSRTLF